MLFRRGLDGFVTAIGKVSFFELFVDTGRQFYDMAAGKSLCPDGILGSGDYPSDHLGAHRHASLDSKADGQYAEDAEAPADDEGPPGEIGR